MSESFLKRSWNRLTAAIAPVLPGHGPLTLQQALPWLVPKVRPRFVYEAQAAAHRPAPARCSGPWPASSP